MLILQIKPTQEIWIGDEIRITYHSKNRIGIEAPTGLRIRREAADRAQGQPHGTESQPVRGDGGQG